MSFEQNMRNFLMVMVLIGWTSNAQAQLSSVDPESIVPLPDTFDMEIPAADVQPELARFHGAWVGTWHDDRHILVVERIKADGHADVVFAQAELGILRHKSRMVAGQSDDRRRRADHDGISHLPIRPSMVLIDCT